MARAIAQTIDTGGALVVEAGTGVGKTFSYLVPRLAQRHPGVAVDRHQDPAGPVVRARPAAIGTCARPADAHGPAQGPLAATCACIGWNWHARTRRCPTACWPVRWARSSNGRRSPAAATWPSWPGLMNDRRVLPHVTSSRDNCLGRAVPAVPVLPCQPGAARGAGGRRGRHQPPSVFCRPGRARVRHGGTAADGPDRRLRRGTPAQRDRRCSSSVATLDRAGDRPGARPARGVPGAGAWPGRMAAACGRARPRRPRPAHAGGSHAGQQLAAMGRHGAGPGLRPGLAGSVRGTAGRLLRRRARRSSRCWRPAPTLPACSNDWTLSQAMPKRFWLPRDPASVRWLDVGAQLRLIESPLDIAQAVQSRLLGSDTAETDRRAWIFTSATLR